jgi:hypothetical protein
MSSTLDPEQAPEPESHAGAPETGEASAQIRAAPRSAAQWPRRRRSSGLDSRALAKRCHTRRSRGSSAFRSSGWGSERPATRSLDPPRLRRPGAGTTNAPTAPRNREHSRALTRTCQGAPRASRPRSQCAAFHDSRSHRRSVKGCRNLSGATDAVPRWAGAPMRRKPRSPG